MYRIAVRSLFLMGLAVSLTTGASADAGWRGLRGPEFDGAVRDAELFVKDQVGLAVGWKLATGPGYSALAVGDGKVMSMFAAGADDVLAAYDVESGEELWRYRIGETYAGHDGSHDGPIATPVMAAGKVFGLGPWGHLFAVEAASGEQVWSTHVADDHGGKKPHYGFASSPVLVDDVLVVEIGGEEGKAVAGFSAADGKLLWTLGDDTVNYQSPIVATVDGQRIVLALGDKNLFGIDAAKGELLFTYEHQGDGSALGSGSAIPVPAGENRFLLLNKTDSSSMVQVTKKKKKYEVAELWSNNSLRSTYVTPVFKDGYFYGISGRTFTCVDATTGETQWRSRQPGDGFPTLVGNYLAIITKPGSMHIVEANPKAYVELAKLDLFDDHSWSEVAYADGHLFARSMGQLARVDPFVSGEVELAADRRGAPGTGFDQFLKSLNDSEDKAATIDAFLADQPSFPIIEGPDTVHFVYRADAEDIGIVGDMVGFRREDPMTHVPGTDLFYYTTRLEPDAAVSYGFIPNFEGAVADPLNDRAATGLFGDVSWFSMPAWDAPDFLGEADVAHRGTLEEVEWESTLREGQTRKSQVYLPVGYADDLMRRYPVVYIHDGKTVLEAAQMKNALDQLIGSRVEPLIAVFVHSNEENARADLGDQEGYTKMVVEELLPLIDDKYRTIRSARGRATLGADSAASTALYGAFKHPELFGGVGSLSAIMNAAELEEFLPTASEHPMVVYFDWGTYHLRSPHEAWDFAEQNREAFTLLRKHGYRPSGGERPDGFGWHCWSAHTDEMLSVLFPMKKDRS